MSNQIDPAAEAFRPSTVPSGFGRKIGLIMGIAMLVVGLLGLALFALGNNADTPPSQDASDGIRLN